MKWIPVVLLLIALVMVMAGGGERGMRAGRSIVLVIAGLLGLAAILALLSEGLS